jgi:STAS domain
MENESTTDFQLSPTGDVGFLALGGDWPPGRALELKSLLVASLAATGHVVLRTAAVTAVSLPFFQILIAANRTARMQSKRLSLEGPFPGALVRAAWVMGILPRTERGRRDPDGCLLMEEVEP